jgi:GNAT superfamily N-acetyltransferase
MTDLIVNAMQVQPIALQPRIDINIRPATLDDFEYIDALQKQHSKMIGFMPRKSFESHIGKGFILIAEEVASDRPSAVSDQQEADRRPLNADRGASAACHMPHASAVPMGYCLARDQYMKRDDVGIIYQLNVMPLRQRHLIGASLVKAVFERAAYGCRLFSCWCAQDIRANWFWESLGFVPLAFRTGSRAKQRIHIFWQRRIRENDEGPTATPYWFPSQTTGGAVAEDRIVLPIPPDTNWRDAKPLVLPEIPGVDRLVEDADDDGSDDAANAAPQRRKRRPKRLSTEEKRNSHAGGLWFPPAPTADDAQAPSSTRRTKRVRWKYHPKYVDAARELCARYLEQVQAGHCLPEAAMDAECGKYDVRRTRIEHGAAVHQLPPSHRLDAA